MYVRGGARITGILWQDRWSLVLLVVLAILTELLEPFVATLEVFTVVWVGIFASAISVFLVFRFNEAYER